MADEEKLIKSIMIRPIFMGTNQDKLYDAIKYKVPVAINRIIVRHAFKFAVAETTVSGGTVANQSDYECPGKAEDCMDVRNVRYGDDLDLLDEFRDVDMDDELHWLEETPTNVYGFARIADAAGNVPMIRLIGTPTAAGKTIKYRYRRRNVQIGEFPDEWLYVLEDSLAACLGDSGIGPQDKIVIMNHRANFEKSLQEMVDHYDKGGGRPNPVRMMREVRNANIRRNKKYGYNY